VRIAPLPVRVDDAAEWRTLQRRLRDSGSPSRHAGAPVLGDHPLFVTLAPHDG